VNSEDRFFFNKKYCVTCIFSGHPMLRNFADQAGKSAKIIIAKYLLMHPYTCTCRYNATAKNENAEIAISYRLHVSKCNRKDFDL
jgi:hypothetical protein